MNFKIRHLLLSACVLLSLSSQTVSANAWDDYKSKYLNDEGAIIDTGNNDMTHSEGQSYGLMFAVAYNDRDSFDKILNWTYANLYDKKTGLFFWAYRRDGGDPVADKNNATDGDLMIANALADKPLPVYGEGLNVRDWLYVEDHCKAIDLIIHNGRVGEVYNVGGHNEKRNIDIVKIICKELNKPESLITYVTDRKGHDMRYAIDPTKIHNELGWLPETKFEDGIKKTIQWYLDNREWWETIISGEYQNYYEKMYGNR